MRKRKITAILAICLVLSLAISPVAVAGPPIEYLCPVVPLWGPYLTNTTETATTINWKTEGATSGTVEYATDEYFIQYGEYTHAVSDGDKQLHHVSITGLVPDTIYHYQVRINNEPTADYTFVTFGSESFTFIVYGDTRGQTPLFTQMERHKLVADRIADEEDISFVVHTGDFVCDGDNLTQWDGFFGAARAMLASTTIYPVLGNHENNSLNYYDAFGVPAWYSFDCGNTHFTVLDSNDWADLTTETEWLEGDLDCDAVWKFVSFHHPPYSSDERHWGGWAYLRDYWEDIFIESDVNAVFNGHVHVYERYLENSIQYMVLGCGGAPLYPLAEEKIPGYQNSMEHTLGYARITVDGEEATMDVIKVADVSEDNQTVTYIYPPNTIFETVILGEVLPPANASLTATANVITPTIGISLDRDNIDYGDVVPGESSAEETVGITNTGMLDIDVTLEVDGADATAQSFYEQSLYIDGALYDPAAVIAQILVAQSEDVITQVRVPSDWNEAGEQRVGFVFWAKASYLKTN